MRTITRRAGGRLARERGGEVFFLAICGGGGWTCLTESFSSSAKPMVLVDSA
ncbi:MAG: hypothetical protein LBQ69_01720 [Treponema sp.]|nr:hypothetical protein [Treponema sp.]